MHISIWTAAAAQYESLDAVGLACLSICRTQTNKLTFFYPHSRHGAPHIHHPPSPPNTI
jgi:hypothetical protein